MSSYFILLKSQEKYLESDDDDVPGTEYSGFGWGGAEPVSGSFALYRFLDAVESKTCGRVSPLRK